MAPPVGMMQIIKNTGNGDLKRKSTFDDHIQSKHAKEEIQDLIVVGFGPAALSMAIALHDKYDIPANPDDTSQLQSRKVTFVERQPSFAWHAGMQLPHAKMQISYLKDLATLRDPRSKFTFLNYLKTHGRLTQFANLGTFLPSRLEFEDYMRWCASHFTELVEYGQEVVKISPSEYDPDKKPGFLIVELRDASAKVVVRKTKNIVIAAGGSPHIPAIFKAVASDRIIHSSTYNPKISQLLTNRDKKYEIAIIGGGQSAAEVFNDLHSRFPNSKTKLILRDSALRPSDDSPFVNEFFDPEAVSTFYDQPATDRKAFIDSNKGTNYSVVRLELLERIYETIYQQTIKNKDKSTHQHQILLYREITEAKDLIQSKRVNLNVKTVNPAALVTTTKTKDVLMSFDVVILATGYVRNSHVELLRNCQGLNGSKDGSWQVGRDYRARLNDTGENVGIWLQGCNESTHGLSDSLLSILATRSGELVDSIFPATTENGE